jgi:hypothetical protein
MLYKCANEACSVPFRKIREGKLFQVETEYFLGEGAIAARRRHPGRRVEHFWLCDSCSPYVTLTVDRQRGVVTMPLPNGLGQKTVRVLSVDPADGAKQESVSEQEVEEVVR